MCDFCNVGRGGYESGRPKPDLLRTKVMIINKCQWGRKRQIISDSAAFAALTRLMECAKAQDPLTPKGVSIPLTPKGGIFIIHASLRL